MATKSGVVTSVAGSGKSLKLDDGNWYGAFRPTQLNGAGVGDNVTFNCDTVEKNGTVYYNIKGNVTKNAGSATNAAPRSSGPAPSYGGGGKYARTFPVGPLDPERTIIRQNALTSAREVWCAVHGDEVLRVEPEHIDFIIDMARKFEAYTSGELDELEAKAAVEEITKSMKVG